MSNANWIGGDQSTRQRFERALNVSNSGTSLLQTFINRTVQMLTLREFGLQAVLARRAGQGDAEYINRRDASGGGDWVADTASVSDQTGTYNQISFPYRTLVTRGKITRKLQATGRTYADILALEMGAKAEDFANSLESGLLVGDTAGSITGVGANANICNGFLTLIQQVNSFGADQLVSNTGTTSNAALSLSKLDEAIDKVKGSSQRGDLAIVGSFAGIRQVNSALQAQQRFNDVTEIAGGFRVRTYDGIPLVVSTAMPNNFQFAANGIISGAAGNGGALLIVNTRYSYISELTPTTVMPLAKTDSQFDEFDMFWDGSPVLSNTFGASMLTSINT
jgi:hypothetical protein